MANYEGSSCCHHCKKPVDVYTDKNGLPYYKCGPCGFFPRFSTMRTGQAFLGTVKRDDTPNNHPPGSTLPPASELPTPGGKKASWLDGVL
jgi:hypothetical protein